MDMEAVREGLRKPDKDQRRRDRLERAAEAKRTGRPMGRSHGAQQYSALVDDVATGLLCDTEKGRERRADKEAAAQTERQSERARASERGEASRSKEAWDVGHRRGLCEKEVREGQRERERERDR